jgi:N utilization substance protein B
MNWPEASGMKDSQETIVQIGTTNNKKPGTGKAARSRARAFVVQALYQFIVGKNDLASVDAFTRGLSGFHKVDDAHYTRLLAGCVENYLALNEKIEPYLDRRLSDVSPIELAALWVGVFELMHCLDIPWRVVMNEAVELAKEFGGTDGHRFVNGILNQAAHAIRSVEVQAERANA